MFLSRFLLAAFVLGGLLVFASSNSPLARAAGSIVVNNLGDTTPGPCATSGTGSRTLREAITFANATAGNETITFGVSGTITLQSSLPRIKSSMTIDATGQQITVDGASNFRVLRVNGTSTTLNLMAAAGSPLTIAHGKCSNGGGAGITNFGTLNVNNIAFLENDGSSNSCLGGGIQNNGVATVQNSSFSQNLGFYGAGIYNEDGSTLSVTASQFTGNQSGTGVGIYNALNGKVVVSNSTFSGNTTSDLAYGGGIRNSGGTVKVDQSTFSGNSAQYGGGIYNDSGTLNVTNSTLSGNDGESGGGGIYNDSGTVNVTNTTFTQNEAPGGNGGALYNLSGTMNVTNSTIWGNSAIRTRFDSGGIYNDGTAVTLRNTIVANNTNYQCYDNQNTLSADSYNLDDDGSCGNATQKTVAAIGLGPLQDNGGPTQTLLPKLGSAAIDAGDDNVCAAIVGQPNYGAGSKDQRGWLRPQLYHCDVGAVEFNAEFARGYVVNAAADTNDGSCDLSGQGTGNQDCTLREAIKAANTDNAGDVITFNIPASDSRCDAANDCIILLTQSLPPITTQLLIDGGASNGHITIVAFETSILTVQSSTLQLNGLYLVNTQGVNPPGTVYTVRNNATLNVTNSTFAADVYAGNSGYGIGNFGTATVTNSTFSVESGDGGNYGGISNNSGGTLNVINSTFSRLSSFSLYLGGNTTTTVRNTILANMHPGGNCFMYFNRAATFDSYSLATDGSCGNATRTTDAALALGQLQRNGGPTPTLKPGVGSAALNAGDPSVCNKPLGAPNYGAGGLDQRGARRPQNKICDVGAVEVRIKQRQK